MKCKDCRWLRGVSDIGAAYCAKKDMMVFETDPACPDPNDGNPRVVWVSYGESENPKDDAVAVFWNKPVFNKEQEKYFDYIGRECEAEFNLLGPDQDPGNVFRALLPTLDGIKGTKKLLRVTIEIVDQ